MIEPDHCVTGYPVSVTTWCCDELDVRYEVVQRVVQVLVVQVRKQGQPLTVTVYIMVRILYGSAVNDAQLWLKTV